jgi:hypothetical protein
MPKIKYDQEMRKSDHGRRLYHYWKNIHHATDSEEFKEFPDFHNWAMQNGYTIGAKLFRYDQDEPFSPDNCFWGARSEKSGEQFYPHRYPEREKQWDEVVNRIRRHYGMEPIHSSEV